MISKLFKHWKAYRKTKERTLLIVMLSLAALIIGMMMYQTGFHNADTGQNMRYLEAELDIELVDRASDFSTYTPEEAYIIGTNYMRYGLLICLAAMLQIGAALQNLYERAS